jgi:hypothetical protein
MKLENIIEDICEVYLIQYDTTGVSLLPPPFVLLGRDIL